VVLAIGIILAIVRPFEKPLSQLEAQDVAEAWTYSVNRLGLLPVYPPEEDFNVGDVWVVIAPPSDKPSAIIPILGEGLRVGHIDLSTYMRRPKDEPVFADTTEQEKEGFRHLDPVARAATDRGIDKISLTLAAFPGVTIRHSIRASGGVGGSLATLGGGRNETETEELQIPIAETYGVPSAQAFVELEKTCDTTWRTICTDSWARQALAFAVTDRVLNATNSEGNYRYNDRLLLRIVYRVFLTREIKHKQYRAATRGAEGRSSIGGSRSAPARAAAPETETGRCSRRSKNPSLKRPGGPVAPE
jgi:hypothetical protein